MNPDKFLQTLTEEKRQRLEDIGFTPEEFVAACYDHVACEREENPAVYCGTFAKYNAGRLDGQWIDLTTFGGDYDDFINYCLALHADEQEPELMFQDYQNFPEEWYDECPSEADFENILKYTEMRDVCDPDAVEAFLSLYGDPDLDRFFDLYVGPWDSEEAFAEYVTTELYSECFRDMPSIIADNIDWQSIADELFTSDYDFEDGFVFRK